MEHLKPSTVVGGLIANECFSSDKQALEACRLRHDGG